MQGTLSEIDIRSILQLIELGQRTGELFVQAYSSHGSQAGNSIGNLRQRERSPQSIEGQSWLVFFLNGAIIYAGGAEGSAARLRHYLRKYCLDHLIETVPTSAIALNSTPEYGCLWNLLEKHHLKPALGRNLLRWMVHETLFDLLSLHQGMFIFETSAALSPQLITLQIDPLVTEVVKQVQCWKQFHSHIQSPDQHIIGANLSQLQDHLPESFITNLRQWMAEEASIRQLARYTHQDIATLGQRLYPLIQQGSVQLSHPLPREPVPAAAGQADTTPWQTTRTPRIVCIDDGVSVRQTIEAILKPQGYEIATIGNPLRALSLVFQLKPDLILCDISMPELDGYEICAMLRQSNLFRQTPIVMLTGRDGFIDRVRARVSGATDYLTKPFGEHELLMLIEKYVGQGDPDRPQPDQLLADALKDELELDVSERYA